MILSVSTKLSEFWLKMSSLESEHKETAISKTQLLFKLGANFNMILLVAGDRVGSVACLSTKRSNGQRWIGLDVI